MGEGGRNVLAFLSFKEPLQLILVFCSMVCHFSWGNVALTLPLSVLADLFCEFQRGNQKYQWLHYMNASNPRANHHHFLFSPSSHLSSAGNLRVVKWYVLVNFQELCKNV